MADDKTFKVGDQVQWKYYTWPSSGYGVVRRKLSFGAVVVEWVSKTYYDPYGNERSVCHSSNLLHRESF